MAILIIEIGARREAGMLAGRVLIGRWEQTGIWIDHRSVSRIHAWIGIEGGHYYVSDAGSRTGTFVNGTQLTGRHFLADGDVLRIGPATVTYLAADSLPKDADWIDLSPGREQNLSGPRGTFVDCACGAPLWLPVDFIGVGQCRYCGRPVRNDPSMKAPPQMPIPPDSGDFTATPSSLAPPLPPVPPPFPPAPPAPPVDQELIEADIGEEIFEDQPMELPPLPRPEPAQRPSVECFCGVCHAEISRFDDMTKCPSCAMVFHTECWRDNEGCSAYGCAQVGALKS